VGHAPAYRRGGRVYPDGDYVIIATAYDSSASVVGEATVTITLQNELTPAEVEEPVTLKVSYDKARKLDFAADGKLLVTLPEEEKKKLGIPLRLDLVREGELDEHRAERVVGGVGAR